MNDLRTNKIIIYLFLAYLILLSFTGYLTFIHEIYNPATDPEIYKEIEKLQDQELKNRLLENLNVESDTYKKTKELAVTSFNIILGAFIGFLATLAVTNKGIKTPNNT